MCKIKLLPYNCIYQLVSICLEIVRIHINPLKVIITIMSDSKVSHFKSDLVYAQGKCNLIYHLY